MYAIGVCSIAIKLSKIYEVAHTNAGNSLLSDVIIPCTGKTLCRLHSRTSLGQTAVGVTNTDGTAGEIMTKYMSLFNRIFVLSQSLVYFLKLRRLVVSLG